jgi:hypothetical protein
MLSVISKFVKRETYFVEELKEVIVHRLNELFYPKHVVVVVVDTDRYNPFADMNV